MSAIHFHDPRWLWLLIFIPVVIGIWIYADIRRRRDLKILNGVKSRDEIYAVYRARHILSLVTLILALGLVVVALGRPGWNPRETVLSQSGRDVVFLLDVSQSMLAQDRSPNRLENAKLAIADCVESFTTERVGLVVFAGSSSIQCPLTRDYEFFRYALEKAGPESVDHGGTLIGEAISKVCEKLFSDSMRGFQDLILLTDGGDHEADSAAMIEKLNVLDAHVVVVGVGSDVESTRIPLPADEDGRVMFLQYQGLDVMTMQDREGLEALSSAAVHGVYLNAGTRPLALGEFYARYTEHAETIEFKGEVVERYEEGFQPFIFAALILLLLIGPGSDALLRLTVRTQHILVMALLVGAVAQAEESIQNNMTEEELQAFAAEVQEIREQIKRDKQEDRLRVRGSAAECNLRGSQVAEEGKYAAAQDWYRLALEREQDPIRTARILYNIATVRVHAVMGDSSSEDRKPDLLELRRALSEYRMVLELDPGFRPAMENLELARIEYQRLADAEVDPKTPESSSSEQSQSSETSDGESTGNSEDGETGDDSVEPSDLQEGSGDSGATSSGRLDMTDRVVPPPNLSPQDLLNTEAEINRMRQQRRSGRRSNVEKDW